MRTPKPRSLVLAGAGLVGAATATTSAISLYGIAVKCGIPEPWAAANPIALDAGAAVAALAWITQTGARRAWGRGIALGALTASLVENGLDHALASGLLQLDLVLVLAVSGCIPAMLFGVIHLAALMARDEAPAKVERARRKPTVKTQSSVGTTPPPGLPTEPTELAGVVEMGKSTRGGSRRDLIRDYMRANPGQRPAEVIRGMAEQGVKVSMKEADVVYRQMQKVTA